MRERAKEKKQNRQERGRRDREKLGETVKEAEEYLNFTSRTMRPRAAPWLHTSARKAYRDFMKWRSH